MKQLRVRRGDTVPEPHQGGVIRIDGRNELLHEVQALAHRYNQTKLWRGLCGGTPLPHSGVVQTVPLPLRRLAGCPRARCAGGGCSGSL
ncbi:MAG: hypothetical protein AAB403_00175, partial [Planctomycetota bacterium]